MSGTLARKDWKEQASQLLRQIGLSRLDTPALFPNKEHLTGKGSPSPPLRDSLARFFSKTVDSLVQIEFLSNLIKLAPQEVIAEKDKMYRELKRLKEKAIFAQLQMKGFLESNDKSYQRTKQLLGDLFDGGVGFAEAEKLKNIMDENRAIELSLSTNYLSLEQLEETEGKLKKEKSNIDQSFCQVVAEKRIQFEKLNNQLLHLLSKNTLKCEELTRICEIIELADKIKFRVSHFRHVCEIRDSFRWAHLLDQFLDLPETSQDIFRKMADRMEFFDTNKLMDFERLKSKLSKFVDAIERLGNLQFFKTILEPVRDIESTDPSIQALIDYIRTSRWTILAKHRLQTKSMTVEELEDLYKNAPAGKKEAHDAVYQKVKELYHQMRLADNQLVLLLKDMRDFLSSVDEARMIGQDSQEKMAAYNKKFTELTEVYENKLDCIESLKNSDRYNNCLGLITALNCALSICLHRPIKRESLDKVELLLWTVDETNLKTHPLLIRVLSSMNDKKIIQEFLSILEQHTLSSSLDDKVDIKTANKYISIMKSEKNPIDYSQENATMDKLVKRFEVWEEAALEFVRKYEINSIEADFSLFKSTELESFMVQHAELMEELKALHFYSDMVTAVLAVHFCVLVLDFFNGPKKRKEEWEQLLLEGQELAEVVPEFYTRVQTEIEKSKELLELGAVCLLEKACFKDIRKLKEAIPQCAISIEEEIPGIGERLKLEGDLSDKINSVMSGEHKLKLVDIERINEDVKNSIIEFGDVGRDLDNILQICKAFITAIKEMRKEPKDIKRAKHVYSSLPLFSPNFEAILTQMEEEENVLEELEDMLSKNDCTEFDDFDRISQMEANVAQVKYYNVERARTGLFKQKVALLVRLSKTPDSTLSLPYIMVKSMRQECSQLAKKNEIDEELQHLNNFLGEVDNEAMSYLASLANVKNPATLDKIKKTIMNFVDISGELIELQARVRLKSGGGRMDSGPLPNIFGSQSLLRMPPQLKAPAPPMLTARAQISSGARPPLYNTEHTNGNGLAKRPEEEGDYPTIPSYMSTLGVRTTGADGREVDMHALRSNMLSSLRVELQKNPFVGENEAECANIAQTIERTVFARANPDGTYSTTMTKLLKLFQSVTKLRRITLLVVAKNYNVDLLMFLMDVPLSSLQDIEGDKEKLLKTLNQANQLAGDSSEQNYFGFKASPENKEAFSSAGQVPLPVFKTSHPQPNFNGSNSLLRKRLPEIPEHSTQALKTLPGYTGPLVASQPQKRPLFPSLGTTCMAQATTSAGSTTPSAAPLGFTFGGAGLAMERLNQEFEEEAKALHPRKDHRSDIDNYKIAKIKPKPINGEEAEQGNKVADILKDADKVVETLRVSLKSIHEKKDIDIIEEEELRGQSRAEREDKDVYKIKKKRSPERQFEMQGKPGGHQESNSSSDQSVWSVYKGTLHFESTEGAHTAETNLDYCDLITLEAKSKVSTFPKLPEKLDLKGPLKQADFKQYIDGLIQKKDKSFAFLLGLVKTNDSFDSLTTLCTKQGAAFFHKYSSYAKLFVFSKAFYHKGWHEQLEVGSKRIYQATSGYYWLLVFNLSAVEKSKPTLTMIDPHAIYNQNLFEGPPLGDGSLMFDRR